MFLYYNSSLVPAYNLALEEYFLLQKKDEIIILWRNSPAVIVGVHQNTISEINQVYIEKHQIPVIRRLTGGGAVYHDPGNVNFTFIQNDDTGVMCDFKRFTKPVTAFLETLGIKAELTGRNDLTIDGHKISGNAQVIKNGRIMHHGTLLFKSVLSDAENALHPDKEKMESKGVKSVRSRITNISDYLSSPMSVEQFADLMYKWFSNNIPEMRAYSFSESDRCNVQKLADEKYNTWVWNYGMSPEYTFQNHKHYNFGSVEVRLNVRGGVIWNAVFYGDFFGDDEISELENILSGCAHQREAISSALEKSKFNVSNFIHGMTSEEFIDLLIN